MHLSNYRWFIYCSGRFSGYFNNANVIEIGSYDINGTIRPLFTNCNYTGIDWRPGPSVDLVSLAHEIPIELFAPGVDIIVSTSMLEHDPYWEKTLEKMYDLLHPTHGLLLLAWGAHGNPRHSAPECPDYKQAKKEGRHLKLHHARPAGQVIKKLLDLGMTIQEFRYEESMPFNKELFTKEALDRRRPKVNLMHGGQKHICTGTYPINAINCACLAALKTDAMLEPELVFDILKKGDEK